MEERVVEQLVEQEINSVGLGVDLEWDHYYLMHEGHGNWSGGYLPYTTIISFALIVVIKLIRIYYFKTF